MSMLKIIRWRVAKELIQLIVYCRIIVRKFLVSKELNKIAVIGYIRLSEEDTLNKLQHEALERYRVDSVYKDYYIGGDEEETIEGVLREMKPNDLLVVYKLDRIGRSPNCVFNRLEYLEKNGIHFVSISEEIDSRSDRDNYFFSVVHMIREMEVSLKKETIRAGIDSARKQGKSLGRPKVEKKVEQALALYANTSMPVTEIIKRCDISRATFYNYVKKK